MRSPIRTLITLYLATGVVLVLVGFFTTGPCPYKNTEFLSNIVFVFTWPAGLYRYVIAGSMTPEAWLHQHACQGGMGSYRTELMQ